MSFWGNGDTTEPQPEFSLRCFHIFVSTRLTPPLIKRCVAYMWNLIAYYGSTAMNHPRSKFSKHSDYFLISYGHCSNCATCAISGKVVGTHIDIRRNSTPSLIRTEVFRFMEYLFRLANLFGLVK